MSHRIGLVCGALLIVSATAFPQGFSPEESAARMTMAPGFSVDLVACEPFVRQPVAIDFDDRGRLWAMQYLQYPNPAGLKRIKVDRYSRTTYDRVPEPPPRGPQGADRLTILEDADGDGRVDRSKDFITGLNLATGFAFGHGGVFVLQAPYLLFYPDRDHDDVPDGDPEVLLQGFGTEDSSSLANSLVWGPDGWLYGAQGTNIMANIRGIEFEQGIWRYEPRSKKFELFAEGGGNMWGLDFDRHGNLFAGTNYGGYLTLHIVQGGYYVKSFAKHGELHNPYAFGYFEHMPHQNFQGGHVTVGGFMYEGELFPAEYRGKYIAVDTLGHAVRWHHIFSSRSTFRSENGGVLLAANDTWFAPSDATLGPDGAVYVADWYDKRTAHPDPDAEWDRSNGRIYRIRYGKEDEKAAHAAFADPRSLSSDELLEWLRSKNGWKVSRARRVLLERRDGSLSTKLRQLLSQEQEDKFGLECLWALAAAGGFDEPSARVLMKHPQAAIREWTIRFLGDSGNVGEETGRQLIDLARHDSNRLVLSQLACSAQRLQAELGIAIVRAIPEQSDIQRDPYIPLLLWWTVEKQSQKAAPQVLDTFATPDAWSLSIVREEILNRLMRRYAAAGTTQGFEACARILSSAPDDVQRRRMIAELDNGLKLIGKERLPGLPPGAAFTNLAAPALPSTTRATRLNSIPTALAQPLTAMWNETTSDPLIIRLAMRLGSLPAQDRAVKLAADSSTPANTRLAMLSVLQELGDESCIDPTLALLARPEPEAVQIEALRVLERFAAQRIHERLLSLYGEMNGRMRAATRQTLLTRQASTLALLREIEVGHYPPAEMTVDELRRAALHTDTEKQIQSLIRKHWGEIQAGTSEEKLAEIRRMNNDLRAATGNVASGKQLFQKHCATCHKLFGEGTEIGPDLTKANRQDQEFLLASMVDPSGQIRKEYLAYVVSTLDGRVLTGLLVQETPSSVTLLGAKNERTTISRADIDELRISSVSIMPENLLQPLKPQELRDLFKFLQSEN